MTIHLRILTLLFGAFVILSSFTILNKPVSAQVFNFIPTHTPTVTKTVSVQPTLTPTITPASANSTLSTTPGMVPLTINPSGPVDRIPAEGQTGIYVDNATDTAIARDGNQMYIGGIFTQVKLGLVPAVPRMRLALLDLGSQTVDPWNPSPNNKVEALALDSKAVYAGGSFTEVAGQPRSYFAAFDRATGQLLNFQPNPNGEVYAIYSDENKIWVGGRFTTIANENRLRLVAFNKPDYTLDTVNIDANGDVYTMAGNETTVYVGGAFTQIGGVERKYIAAIDKATGKVTDWSPQLNNEVRRLGMENGRVVVSGPFTLLNGTEVANYTAEIDPQTATVTSIEGVNAQGTPVPGLNATLTIAIKLNEQALGFKIPNLAEILTFILRMFFVVAGLIAMFYLLMGAMEWITSGGDEEKVDASRKKMVAAIVGVILMVVVLSIVVTLEQIVFRQKICVGISCGATIPSLIVPIEETQQGQ